ncbi:DUF3060 domain-containing protein [[Mycobacterium] holstebronense]|uniref:DUF3060 domain-containing protein n=1 Tax=[Mycobacterium] holstebronense TaxID=3064288 RepID=A0ABN9NAS0_9MYCO|nr:DUF3060 domain-containing protein [Mycolicibacter sp. MU0102]CAJ1501643.1 DUF3060 domain-containing protein [Mycolicibacter sp. MU0102]
MNADDDPEARIRELERPLSDFARPVELTASSGSVDGQAPSRSGSGRGLAIVVSVIAAAVVIAGAVAVFLASPDLSSPEPGRPTMPRGLTPIPLPSEAAPANAPAPVPAPPVAASPANPVPDSSVTLTIAGAGENKTLACDGRYVSVSGVSNTVELTGQCAGLTVSGIGNVITVDSTPKVTASGLNNRVTYHSGDPDVSTSGFDNVVERG